MSAQGNLNRIYELETAIGQFKGIKNDLADYNFDKFKTAGSSQWAGTQYNNYKQQVDNAKHLFNMTNTEVENAINECRGKQYALAGEIDALEHPIIAAEAWYVALSQDLW